MDKLTSLRKLTTIVADTNDLSAIKLYQPEDVTTNPSLILNAVHVPEYNSLIAQSIAWARNISNNKEIQIKEASKKLSVIIGIEILKFIPGRISTEIDARASYDVQQSICEAHSLINYYNDHGISKDRILIKLAATWQGIKAAEQLEQEGINCNMTLIFSFAQARACAEAGVYLISPFVGRILDWYTMHNEHLKNNLDPGVDSVTNIFHYYKQHGYKTIVMGASFRNINEILELAGCDKLTISAQLLQQLSSTKGTVDRKLKNNYSRITKYPKKFTEAEFLWHHNKDAMAVDKLAEGIRNFAMDQTKLQNMFANLL